MSAMTPLGQGILTGMTEVDDSLICTAMDKMLMAAPREEINQTVLDLAALSLALCSALGDCSDTPTSDVLGCVLYR